MSFLLRQITQRATGGEIARETRLESDTIDIGRGSDCAVVLADLAVMLVHARLSRTPVGTLVFQAMGGVPLNLGRKFAERFEIATDQSATLTIGSYELRIDPGANEVETQIAVERMVPLLAANDPAAERRTFTLSASLLGKRRMAWAIMMVILVLGLIWPIGHFFMTPIAAPTSQTTVPAQTVFSPDRLWSSGPLSKVHAGLAQNCRACHVAAGNPVADTACRSCHVKLPDHAVLTKMRRALPQDSGVLARGGKALAHGLGVKNLRCASCHIEHEGPKQALQIGGSFCRDCHANLHARLVDTHLANVQDFARPNGHPEFNASFVMTPAVAHPVIARQSLATRPRESSGLQFNHQQHLSAGNAVARMAAASGLAKRGLNCNYCHVAKPSGSWVPVNMVKNCSACHSLAFGRRGLGLPHGDTAKAIEAARESLRVDQIDVTMQSDRRLPGVNFPTSAARLPTADAAVRALFAKGGACADCHFIAAPGSAGLDFRVLPASLNPHYLPRANFVHAPHKITACTSCHLAQTSTLASDILIPGIATCRQCHVGAVKSLGLPPRHPAGSLCTSCHSFHPKTWGLHAD